MEIKSEPLRKVGMIYTDMELRSIDIQRNIAGEHRKLISDDGNNGEADRRRRFLLLPYATHKTGDEADSV